jgi:hypothetical protein
MQKLCSDDLNRFILGLLARKNPEWTPDSSALFEETFWDKLQPPT